MKNDMVEVLNQETGERGRIRRRLFDSPVFNPGVLVEVPAEQKPYSPLTFKNRLTEPAIDAVDVDDDLDTEDSEEEED